MTAVPLISLGLFGVDPSEVLNLPSAKHAPLLSKSRRQNFGN
jgi:hypothetical protein